MARWFVEYECDTHSGQLFWMPLYLEAPDEASATEISHGVDAALGERYSVTRSTLPRRAVHGHGSRLLAVYGVTGRTGCRALLDPGAWDLRLVPGREPVDLAAPIEFRALRADAQVEQTLGFGDARRLAVRTVSGAGLSGEEPLLVLCINRRAAAGGQS